MTKPVKLSTIDNPEMTSVYINWLGGQVFLQYQTIVQRIRLPKTARQSNRMADYIMHLKAKEL